MGKNAIAKVCGSAEYPHLHGIVRFQQRKHGVQVTAEIFGLPSQDAQGIFAFHIHEGCNCTGTESDPFADAGSHYNPGDTPHPDHAGDLPPLFGNNGYACLSVLTCRFNVSEIIDRVIIIHSQPDDFTTQPSGKAGTKIACGRICACG